MFPRLKRTTPSRRFTTPQALGYGRSTATDLGSAGNISVDADAIAILGSVGETSSQIGSVTFGSGSAGNVTVSARTLEIRDGADLISTSALSLSSIGEPLPESGTGEGAT
ncbi:hypothetical protein POG22_09970 [Geitlerinema sp. CS-897]|nr:hypothetical protein [Geitlerinema sp. CS-897]